VVSTVGRKSVDRDWWVFLRDTLLEEGMEPPESQENCSQKETPGVFASIVVEPKKKIPENHFFGSFTQFGRKKDDPIWKPFRH